VVAWQLNLGRAFVLDDNKAKAGRQRLPRLTHEND
jgi:hypothetical protein